MQALRQSTSRYLARHSVVPSVVPVRQQQLRHADSETPQLRLGRLLAKDASAGKAFSKLTPEDRLDITELCHRFDQAINRADHTAAGKLFAAHAQVHHPRGTVQGTENIVAYFKSVGPMAKGNRHLTVDMVIDPSDSGNRATATSYRLLHKAALPTMLLASGTIEDEFVKEDGSWHFLVRKFIMDPPVTPPAAAQ